MARDYPKEYREYHGKPEQIKNRASRNAARAKMKKKGINVAGKDVDHKDGNPRHNSDKNLRVQSIAANRGRK
jgi:hypothetical protein